MSGMALGTIFPLVHGSDLVKAITIPLFTGAIGYVINWTGVWMLFYPVRFAGFRLPGLAPLVTLLPRKIQQIPGFMHGAVGWQGIIPSRAAKMGSIAVDKGIAKLGSPAEFYRQLEPERIAEHILATSQQDIREVVDRIMEREHGALWRDLPPRLREAVHSRVQEQLPEIVREVTEEIGDNIDQLLDVKLMVIRQMEARPELANRVFGEVGERELKLIVNLGFVFGLVLGIPVVALTFVFPYWWVLPVCGVVVGWVTNLLAIYMIFQPVEPRRLGPVLLHGLFLRRQREVADIYAEIIADDIVTIGNIGEQLLHGPRADRTRWMLETSLRPAVDRAAGGGVTKEAVRMAVGPREYDTIRDSVAAEAVDYTMTPLTDPEFNRSQSDQVQALLSARMREMSHPDFVELLRSAIREDEWLLYLHGAVLGFCAGLVHLAIFGV
ncbi:MAG TPA: hypothetical protein VKG89_05380 [Solirubrobacterales bacterium]|nr:hypothetical protein [Solirubrobacterales bacterium]